MTDLFEEHLAGTANGLVHERFDQLKDRNLRPEYLDHKVVGSESSDHAYLVSKVETLTVPFENADIAADTAEIILCSCDQHYYRCSAGLEVDMNPEEVQHCKHCRSAFRAEKAKADANQQKLVE